MNKNNFEILVVNESYRISTDQLKSLLKSTMNEIVKEAISDTLKSITLSKNLDEYLTRENAAKFLGISKPTLTKLITDKGLIYVRVGRKIMFRRSDLLSFNSKVKGASNE